MQKFFQDYEDALTKDEIKEENLYNINETGTSSASKLITGFAIGDTQRSYIVVDKRLRKKYQASPGKQE